MILEKEYVRERAVMYARKYALVRNPLFYSFAGIGGNCTNFVSQCVLAGSCVMNFTPVRQTETQLRFQAEKNYIRPAVQGQASDLEQLGFFLPHATLSSRGKKFDPNFTISGFRILHGAFMMGCVKDANPKHLHIS